MSPMFKIEGKKLRQAKTIQFSAEKELQKLIEDNLLFVFKINFIASEFSTGERHGGRIDTLGLDENKNPVIIEYKKSEKENIVSQGLFYLDWLVDHKGDFEIAARDKLGSEIKINWDSPRLILIAQNFSKYDKHAINRIGGNVELKTYRLYDGNILFIEDAIMPEELEKIGKKKIVVKGTKLYKVEDLLQNRSKEVRNLFMELREKILDLGPEVKEKPLKHYVAYTTTKNFTEVVLQARGLKIYLDISEKEINDPKHLAHDCTRVGHWATGDVVLTIRDAKDIDYVISLIEQSYKLTL